MTDTLDFVKNLWGSMNIPGAGLPGMSAMSGIATPSLTTDDLDKRIADLKAVESWLNLNLSMLRTTIQTMEVQRSTLSTIKSMGASMAEAMRQSGVSAEKMAGMPFGPFFGQPAQNGTPAAAPPSPPPAAASADRAVKPATGGGTAQPGTQSPLGAGQDGASAATSAMDAAAAMGMPAALAWWNLLQEQFTQAVTHAMASATPPSAAPDSKAMDKPAATPAQPQAGMDAMTRENGNVSGGASASGSGRTRGGRSKADKS
jgi:hypothetical protein